MKLRNVVTMELEHSGRKQRNFRRFGCCQFQKQSVRFERHKASQDSKC